MPSIKIGGDIAVGKDCYVRGPDGVSLVYDPYAACLRAGGDLSINPADPTDNYISAFFYGLTLGNMINTFVPGPIRDSLDWIPDFVRESGFPVLTNPDRPNPSFSYVHSPFGAVTPVGRFLPPGFGFEGQVNFLGYEMYAKVGYAQTSGILIDAWMDPWDAGVTFDGRPVFAILRSHDDRDNGPKVYVKAQYGMASPIPKVDVWIEGLVQLIWLESYVKITVNSTYYHFETSTTIDAPGGGVLAELSIYCWASYGSFKDAAFRVRGVFDNRLYEWLRKQIGKGVEAAKELADSAFKEAEEFVEVSALCCYRHSARVRFS